MPTSQKRSLNSRMNLTRRESAGVSPLMGLTQHHQSNTIHELSGSGDHLKTQMFHFLFVQTVFKDSGISQCHLALLYHHLSYFTLISLFSLTSLSDSLALIIDGAQCQSICQRYFTGMLMNYVPKTVTDIEGKTGQVRPTLS